MRLIYVFCSVMRIYKLLIVLFRNAGDEWLVTSDDAEMYIPEVSEAVVAEVFKSVLSRKEYCIVTDPIDSKGRNQLGKRELRKGVTSFFLHPGNDREVKGKKKGK